MKQTFSHLLVILLFISGLQVRTWAGNFHEAKHHEHAHSHCDPCHNHEAPSDNDSPHGEDCPEDHHHHHCCGHIMPLGIDLQEPTRLGISASAKLSIHHEGDSPPDEPFLGSEKPPLI